jgi:hypothetical protein
MTLTEMEQRDSGQQFVIKAVLLFFAAFALYFLTHTPALDEIDAVQFAMGVRSFDLWHHQPHPPGYPLFIFLGWLGTKLFHVGTESSLYGVSALGGGLFIATWFSIIRLQFSERLAWWVATCLLITPVVWMTATKVLTDMLAAGLMSVELLAAICFLGQQKRSLIVLTALLGAAAAGTRPQLFPVVAVILGIPLKKASVNAKTWWFAYGVLVAGCLTWLLPMWYIQSQLRPSEPFWRVYPDLVYGQWRWRLNRPSIYIGAGDWSPHYLGKRFASHVLGWFSKGLGFIQSPRALAAGIALTTCAVIAYLRFGRDAMGSAILEISRPVAFRSHCDCFCRSSRRSKILSHGFSAAACGDASRFSTITKTVEPVGNLRSRFSAVHRRCIGHRKSPERGAPGPAGALFGKTLSVSEARQCALDSAHDAPFRPMVRAAIQNIGSRPHSGGRRRAAECRGGLYRGCIA